MGYNHTFSNETGTSSKLVLLGVLYSSTRITFRVFFPFFKLFTLYWSVVDYSLEGLLLKLKLQYFGYLRQRANSLKYTLMLGKIEGKRRRAWQRMRWLDGMTDSANMNLSKLPVIVEDRAAWHARDHGAAKSRTWLCKWTTITYLINNVVIVSVAQQSDSVIHVYSFSVIHTSILF